MLTIHDLTLDEKLKLLTGKNLWQTEDFNGKIPSIFFADGPCGLRKMKKNEHGYYENIPSIVYPSPVNLANTWNKESVKQLAELISEDCIENEIDVLLAPGVNIKRTPLCGRNFEYFSEDPFLAGTMAENYITGLQSRGVATCVKHFCVNNREISRYCQSSEISERALQETYLTAFKIALQAKPVCVMSSYNPVNGVYASENKKLLTSILREQLKFDGLIISDWMGVKNSYKALKAGTDIRMPWADKAYDELKNAYDKGLITEKEINNAVSKILETIKRLEVIRKKAKINYSKDIRRKQALSTAEESIVLLKNNEVLPLKNSSVCVIGELNSKPYICGGGAACVLSEYKQTPLNELLSQKLGYSVPCSKRVKLDGLDPSHNDREGLLLAEKNDISIVIVGDNTTVENEGKDRDNIKLLPKEESLIKSVAKTGTKTVVIIEAGSAIDTSNWIDEVDSVIFAGYLGDNCNEALANVLVGKVCPSGKLSETFPVSLQDTFCKAETGNGSVENYSDGVLVGYKYYEAKKIPVAFPFGYGLSYAKFEYSNLIIEKIEETKFVITYDITNVSNIDAYETSQLYIKDSVSTVLKPEKELKGYSKDFIKAHQTKKVKVTLNENSFSHFDVIDNKDYIENGVFIIMIGSSSEDIKLQAKINICLPEETQHSVY